MPPIFPVEVCHNIIECGGDDNSVVNITTLLSKTWFDLTVAKRWRQLTSHGFPKTGDYERTLQKLQAHPARCNRVRMLRVRTRAVSLLNLCLGKTLGYRWITPQSIGQVLWYRLRDAATGNVSVAEMR